ncbi:MAG TPA: Uma2 family endonuclease, partial [Isosphaeraceae bacterium]|nr:Uma2 family endonuclease [Isosphaeraceae bacterium]
MATTSNSLLTAEEFMELYADRGNFELVRGEVIELSPTRPEHGIVCLNIGAMLRDYGKATGFGYGMVNDTAVVTERGPDTVRGADV